MKCAKLSDLPLDFQKKVLLEEKKQKKSTNDLSFLDVKEDKQKREVTRHNDCWADGIHFKSNLERDCYLWFKSEGIFLNYEANKIMVNNNFSTHQNVKIWIGQKKKNSKERILAKRKNMQAINYTPDFKYINGLDIFYIETKGNANQNYPMRRKLFFQYLDMLARTTDNRYYFFEAHTNSEICQTCEIIKSIIAENGRKESDIQRDIQHA